LKSFVGCPIRSKLSHNGLYSKKYDGIDVLGIYLQHKKKQKLYDFQLKEMKKRKHSILVGDYNTGKNHIDQKRNSFWYTDKIVALEKSEYVDAFGHMHKDIK